MTEQLSEKVRPFFIDSIYTRKFEKFRNEQLEGFYAIGAQLYGCSIKEFMWENLDSSLANFLNLLHNTKQGRKEKPWFVNPRPKQTK